MSIKKKFVTAITTAGLLAGLFGSAFVPSAFARSSATDAPAPGQSGFDIDSDREDVDYNQDGVDRLGGTSGEMNDSYLIASHQEAGDDDLSIGFTLNDSSGDPIQFADLVATSTGFVEVGWAYRLRNEEDGEGPYRPKSCESDYMDNSVFALSDSITGAKSDGDLDSSVGDFHNEGEFFLCFRVIDDTKPGKSTITVKANGVTLSTTTMTVLGDLASLTLSAKRGYTQVARANHEIDDFFTIVAKDSAGQVINTGQKDTYIEDYTGTSLTEAGSVKDAQGDLLDFVDGDFDFMQTMDLQANVCDAEAYLGAANSDDGKSYALAVKMNDWDGDAVTSNSVTITCTGPTSKAVLSGIVAETATGEADWAASTAGKADSDDVIGIYATVKDAAGLLIGLDDSMGFDISVSADFSELDLNELESQVGPGGKIMLGYIIPDMTSAGMQNGTKYAYEVEIADANFGTLLAQKLTATLYYTVVSGIDLEYSLTRVRNAAKTVATWTADYGVACSNSRIEFNWENGDGTKFGTVSRRANIDGVAKFSLARRNTTIYVYAGGCANQGADSDDVKARFR